MFTVVIPVYNHAAYLAEAVQSSLASELVTEVIVCDDGSSDASAEVLKYIARSDPRVRNVTETPPRNIGAHNRLNQLCGLATNEYIAVLNSDDRFVPGRFEICQQLIRRHNVDFICGHLLIMDGRSQVFGTKQGVLQPEYPYPDDLDLESMIRNHEVLDLLASQNFIATTSNMVFTKTLHRAAGGFADLRYAHDYDFALRAALLGRCHYTSHFLTSYRVHATNTISESGNRAKTIAELHDIFDRFLRDFPFIRQRERFMRLMRERPVDQHFELVA